MFFGTAASESPQPPKRRRGLLIVGLVAALFLVAAGAAGIAYWALGGKDYAVDSCVVRAGDTAKSAKCETEGAYKITKVVDSQDKCDPTQPVVILERTGRSDEVLCLKPAAGK